MSSLVGDNGAKLRDSFISVITTSSDIVPTAVAAGSENIEPDGHGDLVVHVTNMREEHTEPSPQSEVCSVPTLPRAPPSAARKRTPRPSTSPGPSRATGLRLSGVRNLSIPPMSHSPRTPPTPPPFSNYIQTPAPYNSLPTATNAETGSPDFHARRRRAAKLSKFFGVEVNTLAEALPNEISSAMAIRKSVSSVAPKRSVSDGVARAPSLTVAEAKNRRRFLGAAEENDVKELDMTEVIEQLRRMKSH